MLHLFCSRLLNRCTVITDHFGVFTVKINILNTSKCNSGTQRDTVKYLLHLTPSIYLSLYIPQLSWACVWIKPRHVARFFADAVPLTEPSNVSHNEQRLLRGLYTNPQHAPSPRYRWTNDSCMGHHYDSGHRESAARRHCLSNIPQGRAQCTDRKRYLLHAGHAGWVQLLSSLLNGPSSRTQTIHLPCYPQPHDSSKLNPAGSL